MKLLKWLGFDPEKHSVRTEILAGLTTFLTMAYILAVNPNVFDALGGEMSKARREQISLFTAWEKSCNWGFFLFCFGVESFFFVYLHFD